MDSMTPATSRSIRLFPSLENSLRSSRWSNSAGAVCTHCRKWIAGMTSIGAESAMRNTEELFAAGS